MTILLTKLNLASALTAVALLAATPAASWAAEQPKTDAAMTKVDKMPSVNRAAGAVNSKIDSPKRALDRGESKDVKKSARMMIKDPTKAPKRLMAIVKRGGDPPPPDTLAPADA